MNESTRLTPIQLLELHVNACISAHFLAPDYLHCVSINPNVLRKDANRGTIYLGYTISQSVQQHLGVGFFNGDLSTKISREVNESLGISLEFVHITPPEAPDAIKPAIQISWTLSNLQVERYHSNSRELVAFYRLPRTSATSSPIVGNTNAKTEGITKRSSAPTPHDSSGPGNPGVPRNATHKKNDWTLPTEGWGALLWVLIIAPVCVVGWLICVQAST